MMHIVRPLTKQPIHVFAVLSVINTSQLSLTWRTINEQSILLAVGGPKENLDKIQGLLMISLFFLHSENDLFVTKHI